jgi:hypothetical protein
MKRLAIGLIVGVVAAWTASTATAQQTLSYKDLLDRYTNLKHLAVLPAEGETCKQWSSWDRASKYDEAAGKYVHWDANGDGGGIIRREGDLSVMAEMEGPGCIVRIWSAQAQNGRVKIYLDGQETPAVDLPFKHYFSGDTKPFHYPMFSYDLNKMGCSGQNLYMPIPYQKSCKIVAEKGWGNYYQFNYVTFPKGTTVPTFSSALAEENADALARLDARLAKDQGTQPATYEGQETAKGTAKLAAGASDKLELTGARAITAIKGRMVLKDRADQMTALRKIVLQITFDGQEKPSVWCPLGDFFGTAPGYNPYRSLPTGMNEEGGYCFWYMPFGQKAVVELINQDSVEREVEFEVCHAPLNRPFEGLGHFHCKWHRDQFPLPPDRWPDWVMLRTEGRGRFCGVMLHVWNPRGGWWGEGDEKFFVDGEKFPSTIGTGSEDYFGYAWCNPGLFQRPFHAQTMTSGNHGHQSVLRWHVADNVPFQKSFEACIEKYYKTSERGTEYASTVCWYLAPGGTDPYEPVPAEKRNDYYVDVPIEAGGFPVAGTPPGNVQTQELSHFKGGKWKNNDHLWWTGAKPGDKLEVIVPVKKAGTYQVSVVLTKARDYGIVQLSLDGKKAADPIDLYNPEVINTDPIPLGTFELTEGKHKLGIQITGANDKAVKSYMFGLDYVIFDKK